MSNKPTFREALRFWLKLGFVSFGGPAGQIAMMHRELVERRKWVEESRFLHALNFCMLLPGPEATQLATYCGWLLHGVRGGLVAGVLFILPGAVALWGLSWLYVSYGALPQAVMVLHGLKAAVLAIVVASVWRVGRRALRGKLPWVIAAVAFVGLAFFQWSFPWVVIGALLLGFAISRFAPDLLPQKAEEVLDEPHGDDDQRRPATLKTISLGLLVWFSPILLAGAVGGWNGTLAQLGWFFSKAAVVTFGGAYAVLPYVGQQAAEHYHWLTPGQMIDGLAFAETTPGPLIIVLEFVGFMAGWAKLSGLPPLLAATLGAGMTLWVTFVPTYLFVLVGAPYVERLRRQRHLSSALSMVTAAVVGVILNLAVWFGWHVILPAGNQIDFFALGLTAAAFVALQFFKVEMIWVVVACGLTGLGWGVWIA